MEQAHVVGYSNFLKIGDGTYGEVFQAISNTTNNIVAIKQMKLRNEDDGIGSTAIREVAFLKELKHCNIVKLQDVLIPNDYDVYLVFEYFPMDLKDCLDNTHPGQYLDTMVVKSYLYQILEAIKFCHQRRVMHRDLKPQNLLVDDRGLIKLTDFGLARTFTIPTKAYSHEVVTLWYRAPEVLLGETNYTTAVDLWSIGCIFAEMVTNKPLFHGDSEIDQLYRIFRILTTPTERLWPGVSSLPDFKAIFPKWRKPGLRESVKRMESTGFDLLERFLTYEPSRRISAKSALIHDYFDDLDYSLVPSYTQS